jgi:hypothetical protein
VPSVETIFALVAAASKSVSTDAGEDRLPGLRVGDTAAQLIALGIFIDADA